MSCLNGSDTVLVLAQAVVPWQRARGSVLMSDNGGNEPFPTSLPGSDRYDEVKGDSAEIRNRMSAGNVGQAIQAGSVQGGLHVYAPVESIAAATHTLPRDIATFTGRTSEVAELTEAVLGRIGTGRLIEVITIDGMAGVGKTALAVHVAHALAGQFPDGQIFLRLYGNTPGQKPVEPAEALATLLLSAGVAPQQIPPGLEARVALWRDRTASSRMLLLLDDASSSSQVKPLVPGGTGTLVLLTSRRRLVSLTDTLPVTLETLRPDEAKDLLVRLTGLTAVESDLIDVARLCGYLPLAISLTAGRFKHHRSWTFADLANELASSKDRLESMRADDQSVSAAFDVSYRDLTPSQQLLFRRLGSHPGADFDAYHAAALVDMDLRTSDRLMDGLYTAHLVDETVRSRYRFHDLISAHARTMAGEDDPAERAAAITRLMSYYVSTARAADLHITRHARRSPDTQLVPPAHAPTFDSRARAVAWMSMERVNLHAVADYAGRTGHPWCAIAIAAALHAYLRSHGHWDQAASLHRAALAQARGTGDRSTEAGALQNLGDIQRLIGKFPAAVRSQESAITLYRELGDWQGEAASLNHLGFVLRRLGEYPTAAARLERALDLYRKVGDRRGEAEALNYLGDVQRITGDYSGAAANQEKALILYREMGDQHGEANVLCSQGDAWRLWGNYAAATQCLIQALQLARDLGSRNAEANSLNYLGDVQMFTGDYTAATHAQETALALYRELGNQHGQANALNYLGNVQCLSGDYAGAAASQETALALYRELGNRYGEVQTLLSLGTLSLVTAQGSRALAHYELALAIARDIGVVPEEAQAIEGVARCRAESGNRAEATRLLQRALDIYQSIGSSRARDVTNILSDLGSV
jgi:tetratricopeptide (TPR) repeat protein